VRGFVRAAVLGLRRPWREGGQHVARPAAVETIACVDENEAARDRRTGGVERGLLHARVRRLRFRRAYSRREANKRRRKEQKRSSAFPSHCHAAHSVIIGKPAVNRRRLTASCRPARCASPAAQGLAFGKRWSKGSRRVAGKLRLGDVGVGAPLRQEFAVAPALDDTAAVEDADFVGLRHRRQPVGDHDRGAPFA